MSEFRPSLSPSERTREALPTVSGSENLGAADRPGTGQTPRLAAIDALRGLAALIVVFPHSGGFFSSLQEGSWSQILMTTLGEWGRSGVDIFFVLSGFVIATTSAGRALTFGSVPHFMRRRLVRIAPPYWVSIVLMLAGLKLQSLLGRGDGSFPSLGDVAGHLFYLQDILGIKELNAVYWTLCLEIQFYLFFAIAVAAINLGAKWSPFSRGSAAMTGLIGSAAASFAFHFHEPAARPFHGLFFGYWHEFALGILAFVFIKHSGSRAGRLALATIGTIGVVAVCTQKWDTLVAVATAFLILDLGRKSLLSTQGNQPVVQYFGRISYSLYLVHVPVIFLWLAARMRFHPERPLASWVFFGGMFLSAILLAHLLNVFVERPSIRWSKRCPAV